MAEMLDADAEARLKAHNRYMAVCVMLYVFDPQLDHDQQDYVELLRRAQNVLAVEFHRVRVQQERA